MAITRHTASATSISWIPSEAVRGMTRLPSIGAWPTTTAPRPSTSGGAEHLLELRDADEGWVRFRQSAGGRTGLPAPRRVNRPPFVQLVAPTAWTSIELTINVDEDRTPAPPAP